MTPKNIKIYKLLKPAPNVFFEDFAAEYLFLYPEYQVSFDTIKDSYKLIILTLCGYNRHGEERYSMKDYVIEEHKDLSDACSHLTMGLELCDAQEIELEALPTEFYKKIQDKLVNNPLVRKLNVFDLLGDKDV